MAFAWAERVRRVEGGLRAENIQVPVLSRKEGKGRVGHHALLERVFCGYAYREPAPDWFAPGAAGPEAEPPALDAWERRWHTTPLARLCRHPEVLLALAQDRLAATLAPILHQPDLLAGEDRLYQDWTRDRPEAAAEADRFAEADGPPVLRHFRRRLRRAAVRRLDAAALGREIFRPGPAYFGEPYLAFDLAPGLVFKAGIVQLASYWPSPEGEARSRAWRANGPLVAAAEEKLFPIWPAEGRTGKSFAAAAAGWLALAPLRDFELCSPLPLFPGSTMYPEGWAPPGFRVRIRPETMRALGGSYLTLAAAGLSPYVAEPFLDYCANRGAWLDAAMGDPAGLAAAKWAGFAPALAYDMLP
jgi:hypothetical protein